MKFNIKLKLSVFLTVILFCSCAETHTDNEGIPKIDVLKAHKNRHPVKLSEFASSTEYIPLETSKKCLINRFPNVYTNNEFIVIKALHQILVFNRKTGEFVKQVGHYGKSPGGYRSVKRYIVPNFKQTYSMTAVDWDINIIEYSIKNERYRKITKFDKTICTDIYYRINDTTLLLYYHYWPPQDITGLALINNKGDFIKTVSGYNAIKAGNINGTARTHQGNIFRYKGQIFFKEDFNDTLFIFDETRLKPEYIFNTAKYCPMANFKKNTVKEPDIKTYLAMRWYCGASRYIFFNFFFNLEYHASVYDKKTNELRMSYSKATFNLYENTFKEYRFINDIDNFIDFNPKYVADLNNAVTLIQAYEIVKWFDENPEKAANLPPHLQKLKSIKETDNPVVMIVKLKE